MTAEVLSDFVTEDEFLDEVHKRNIKLTKRTIRKWRQRKLIPFAKVGKTVLLPRGLGSTLKINKAK